MVNLPWISVCAGWGPHILRAYHCKFAESTKPSQLLCASSSVLQRHHNTMFVIAESFPWQQMESEIQDSDLPVWSKETEKLGSKDKSSSHANAYKPSKQVGEKQQIKKKYFSFSEVLPQGKCLSTDFSKARICWGDPEYLALQKAPRRANGNMLIKPFHINSFWRMGFEKQYYSTAPSSRSKKRALNK